MSELSALSPIDDDEAFFDLMKQVREGSDDAVWELVCRYQADIRRAVRQVLAPKLRSKFDSFDFVQSVWRSFFRMRDQAERFQTPGHLVKFLVGMATNKVQMENRRRLGTQKRDVGREVPFVEFSSDREGKNAASGPEPEPVDIAIARERWEQLLRGQPAHYRQIIKLKLKGHTCGEIATMLGLDIHTVERFLNRQLNSLRP